MTGAGAVAERRTSPLRLATWHAGSGDNAVIRPHYRGSDVAFGSFDCAPGDVRWRLENQVGDVPHIVFPITPWQVAVGDGEPELVTRNHVVFFNADEAFRRAAFGAHGDRSHFMTLHPQVAEEILYDVAPAPAARFPQPVGRLSSRPFLAEMLVRRRLAAGADSLDAAERLLALAREAVIGAFGAARRAPGRPPRFVEDAKALLTAHLAEHLTLPEIGAALNVSAYHLARTFRAHTGYSLHGYRLELRLRLAAELVADGATDLREVAARVGFSSHSHFTAAFRKLFGIPPSAVRDRPLLSSSCGLSRRADRIPVPVP
jgi:AraC family transcriptional regulator